MSSSNPFDAPGQLEKLSGTTGRLSQAVGTGILITGLMALAHGAVAFWLISSLPPNGGAQGRLPSLYVMGGGDRKPGKPEVWVYQLEHSARQNLLVKWIARGIMEPVVIAPCIPLRLQGSAEMNTTQIHPEADFAVSDKRAHGLEQHVHRALCRNGGQAYSSVVVRRLPNGVCLEGVVRASAGQFDPSRTARQVPGVKEVLNHLVHCTEMVDDFAECR